MPIIGIDYEKCAICCNCVRTCPRCYFLDEEQNKVVFQDLKKRCNWCGQCIATCPEDAILYDNMGEPYIFEGAEKPETIASYDTIYKILRANRSVRRYKKDKVPTEILKKVFRAMECAPTAGNTRFEKFAILSDEKKIKSLSDAVVEELLKNPMMKDQGEEEFAFLAKEFHSSIYYDAPHVIFVYTPFYFELGSLSGNQIGNIITYGRLAAHALGLGTCWNGYTQIAMGSNSKIKRLAGITGKSNSVITIGYPDLTFYRCPPRSQKCVKGL